MLDEPLPILPNGENKTVEIQVNRLLESADSYSRRDDTYSAKAAYIKATSLAQNDKPLLWSVLCRFGQFYYYRTMFADAARVLKQAENIDSLDRNHLLMLGQSLYCIHQEEQAISILGEVTDYDEHQPSLDEPEKDFERSEMAFLYIKHGHPDQADDLYANAIQRAQRSFDASGKAARVQKLRLALANAYKRTNEFDKAINILKSELSSSENAQGVLVPATVGVRSALAGVYLKAGRYPDAAELYTNLVARYKGTSDDANALAHEANFYWEAGRFTQCEKTLKDAIAVGISQGSAKELPVDLLKTNLLTVLKQEGEFDEADKLTIQISPDAFTTDPFQLIHVGKPKQAIELGKRSVAAGKEDDGSLQESVHELAGLYCELGMFAQARDLLMQQVRREKKHSPVLTRSLLDQLASVYIRLGKFSLAEQLYKERLSVAQRWSQDELVEAQFALANFYFENKQYTKAQSLVTRIIAELRSQGRRSELIEMTGDLAIVRARLGYLSEAANLLERLLREQFSDCSTEIACDPLIGFNTTGLSGSTSSLDKNVYKNNAEERIIPVFLAWIHEPPANPSDKGSVSSNVSAQYPIPMVEWFFTPSFDYRELRSDTRLALYKLYTQLHDTTKANAQRTALIRDANAEIASDEIGPITHRYGYEQLLKRLPQSPDIVELEGVLKAQRLKAACENY
ncbi:MAG TPA: tetratricopeptide repeat protein [Planktothrix sp.]